MARAQIKGAKQFDPRQFPKLALALIVFVAAISFVLSQFGVFKTDGSQEAQLDVIPTPSSVSPDIGSDSDGDGIPDALEAILPCDSRLITDPKPGENCLISFYAPGADPIGAPEGREDPFQPI